MSATVAVVALLACASARADNSVAANFVGLVSLDSNVDPSVIVTVYKPQITYPAVPAGTACYNANSGDKSRYELRLKKPNSLFREILSAILMAHASKRAVDIQFNANCEITAFSIP